MSPKYEGYTNIDGSLKFDCGYCGRNHCSFDRLQNHIWSGRDSEEKRMCLEKMNQRVAMGIKILVPDPIFPCEKCGKPFASKDSLMSHLETHNDRKSIIKTKENQVYKCDLCQNKFSQLKNYQRHMLLAYDGQNPRNVCDLFDDNFCTIRLLKRHRTESHKVSCPTCDDSFSTQRALNYHIKNMDSATCDKCNKIFCNKKTFNIHKRYYDHDEERLF